MSDQQKANDRTGTLATDAAIDDVLDAIKGHCLRAAYTEPPNPDSILTIRLVPGDDILRELFARMGGEIRIRLVELPKKTGT